MEGRTIASERETAWIDAPTRGRSAGEWAAREATGRKEEVKDERAGGLGEQSVERTLAIGLLTALMAVAAFGFGFPVAALGVIAGGLVGQFNYWLSRRALRQLQVDPKAGSVAVMTRSFTRLGLSAASLFAAMPFGSEAIFGVFAGLMLELLTYFGEIFLFIARRK